MTLTAVEERSTDVSAVFSKAPVAMLVKLEGRLTDTSDEQSLKAAYLMLFVPAGTSTCPSPSGVIQQPPCTCEIRRSVNNSQVGMCGQDGGTAVFMTQQRK